MRENKIEFALTVEAPTAKAKTSVREVTVIATPDLAKVFDITLTTSSVLSWSRFCKDCMITNISSMPRKWRKRNV